MNEESLYEQNPWWKASSNISNDLHLKELDSSSVKWEPRILKYFNFDQDLVYTLRGPRQVGKTTLIKTIIRNKLMDDGIHPFSIFYFSSDQLDSRGQIVELVEMYGRLADRFGAEGRRFIFIDEITNVKGWERAIKHICDTGGKEGKTFILTGSHSIDLRYSIERLPGRRGEGKGHVLNKILVPMKFSEYVETLNRRMAKGLSEVLSIKRERRNSIVKGLFNGEIDPILERSPTLYSRELERLLDDYLLTGGIPRPINHLREAGRISNDIYGIYVRSLMGDLARWGMSERIAKQVIRSLVEKMTTRISLNSISKDNEIGSHNTVLKYLDALENSFVLNTFYQLELDRLRIKTRSEKKVYLSDPFIYHALRGWTFGKVDMFQSSIDHLSDPEIKGRLVEMVISNHLIRMAYNRAPSDLFSHHERVLFWRKKGAEREVDFIMMNDGDLQPLEVKFTKQIRGSDLRGIYNFKRGIVVTKDILESRNNYAFIPARIFLLLI